LIELFFLVSELVGEVLVALTLNLNFRLEVFDVRVLVSADLGEETLLVGLLLGFELLFEIFVGIVGGFLLLIKLFFFLLVVLCSSFKLFYQDGLVLKLDVENLDLGKVCFGLGYLGLELGHTHELGMDLSSIGLDVCHLIFLRIH
jgi:hypothetical protein